MTQESGHMTQDSGHMTRSADLEIVGVAIGSTETEDKVSLDMIMNCMSQTQTEVCSIIKRKGKSNSDHLKPIHIRQTWWLYL